MGDSRIIDTLAYSSIFSSALSIEELYYFLHTDRKIRRANFEQLLRKNSESILIKHGYVALLGHKEELDRRIRGETNLRVKIKRARSAALILSFLPTVYFVGLTGSVAAGGFDDDDIDFFIITKEHTLFVTRFLAVAALLFFGVRRRNERRVKNKICLNMFCDMSVVGDFGRAKNIYTAREVAQMIPLFSRVKSYTYFLESNKWVKRYVAHAGMRFKPFIEKGENDLSIFIAYLEPAARSVSRYLIKRHGGIIQEGDQHLFFYPIRRQNSILKRYKEAGGLL